MLRLVAYSGLIFLAACSHRAEPSNQAAAAVPTPASAQPSADALAAKAVAARYFDLLRAGDYTGALALWNADAAVATGGAASFARAMRATGTFDARADTPSAVRDSGGERFVLVDAAARITPAGGPAKDQYGVVMLKRPVAGGEWRIWGVDIRGRHCREGETPRGLGCVRL